MTPQTITFASSPFWPVAIDGWTSHSSSFPLAEPMRLEGGFSGHRAAAMLDGALADVLRLAVTVNLALAYKLWI